MPCSRQYSSQHALPIWTPACPTWMDKHSRIIVISKAKTAKQRVQSTLLPSRMGTAAATASSAITMSAKGQNAVDNNTIKIHQKNWAKISILTKPQHFHEFFTQIFFDNFSREILPTVHSFKLSAPQVFCLEKFGKISRKGESVTSFPFCHSQPQLLK